MGYFDLDEILAGEERVFVTFNVDAYGLMYLDPSAVRRQENRLTEDEMEDDEDEGEDEGVDGGKRRSGRGEEEDEAARTLPAGSRLEIPFWMAESLGAREFVSLELPRCFGSRVRHELQADALNVNLFQKSPFYFEWGMNVCRLVQGEGELPRILSNAFAERIWKAVDQAYNVCTSAKAGGHLRHGPRPIGIENCGGGSVLSAAKSSTAAASVKRKLDNLERRIYSLALSSAMAYSRWKDRSAVKIRSEVSLVGRKRYSAPDRNAELRPTARPFR